MSWLIAKIYDRFMAPTEEACLAEWRAELLGQAHGQVLEIGGGTGANLGYYPSGVELTVAEPDPHMRQQLQARAAELRPDADIVDWAAEELGAADATFDTVVGTLVLCTVGDPARALREIRRVLRPGGRFIFLEHVAADEESSRHRWQRRVEPVWKHVAGNCHLTRRTEETIGAAGFAFESISRESMRKALPIIRPTIRGVAS